MKFLSIFFSGRGLGVDGLLRIKADGLRTLIKSSAFSRISIF